MRRLSKDSWLLYLSILIGLVNGLIYINLVPPWQHSDEPTHFEYAWLLANRSGFPQPGDYDQDMRRQVLESMIENDFFRGMDFLPDLTVTDQPLYIGSFPQLNDSPTYYLIVSLPLRLLRESPVDIQLFAGRLVSLLMFLVTLLAAYGVASQLTSPGHPLRMLLPTVLALLPGFVDLMTSINNDVGAVMFFSLAFWGMVRLVVRGFSWRLAAATALATILATLTKESAFVSLPVFLVALLLSIFRGKYRWLGWGVLFAGIIAGMLLVFSWGDARFWGRQTYQSGTTRVAIDSAPLGAYAIRIRVSDELLGYRKPALHQMLPLSAIDKIRSKTVTVGAWIWASQPVYAQMPILNVYESQPAEIHEVKLGTQPAFYAYQVTVVDSATRAWISLYPQPQPIDSGVTIFFDGILLAEGTYEVDATPQPDDATGAAGHWGGETYKNLVRNGSGEAGWYQVRSSVDRLGARVLPDETAPSWMAAMARDREGAGWLFSLTFQRLFRTFWGVFGWNHVEMLGEYTYPLLAGLTGIGIIGAVGFSLWWRKLNFELVGLFVILLIGVWGAGMLRGSLYMLYRLFIPVARYVYPAIIATLFPLVLGWWSILDWPRRNFRLPEFLPVIIILLIMSIINLIALFSIAKAYLII